MAHTQVIFVNLPVLDLAKSEAFYRAIGFEKNEQFSDDTAICMTLSNAIGVMLLTHPKWQSFTTKSIPNSQLSAQTLLAISRPSRDSVNAMVEAGKASGGKADPNPTQDFGFMYGRSLEDPDGHIWEPFWMDENVG
ncbi:MAG: VOC family protein [Bdellovibrionia bacterium]